MLNRMDSFDSEHADVLRRMWFLGDVHGDFTHLANTLLQHATEPGLELPRWIIFLGDLDLDKPLGEMLAPMRRRFPEIKVAFIYGNHDADDFERWELLHDDSAVACHGKVIDIDGVRVAGLGGNFLGRVWCPPAQPSFRSKELAMNRGAFQFRGGQRPNPSLNAAIYPDDYEALAKLQRVDILITHEAPGCHQYGFHALSDLARGMGVVRAFHGHHHDDQSEAYALVRDELGFDARAVSFCGIKNGLGEIVFEMAGTRKEAYEEDSQW